MSANFRDFCFRSRKKKPQNLIQWYHLSCRHVSESFLLLKHEGNFNPEVDHFSVGDLWSGSPEKAPGCRMSISSTPGQTTYWESSIIDIDHIQKGMMIQAIWKWWSWNGVSLTISGKHLLKNNVRLYLAKSDQLSTNNIYIYIMVLPRFDKPKALPWVFPVSKVH